MTPAQAHELKLLTAAFAESTAMLAFAENRDVARWELALKERDSSREALYKFIDELTEE